MFGDVVPVSFAQLAGLGKQGGECFGRCRVALAFAFCATPLRPSPGVKDCARILRSSAASSHPSLQLFCFRLHPHVLEHSTLALGPPILYLM